MHAVNKIARDHARTPMQWNGGHLAGFSEGEKTWLTMNDNFVEVNVEAQENNPDSILNYYKNLLKIRKNTPALIFGTYQDLSPNDENLWIYKRSYQGIDYGIVVNFTTENQSFYLPFGKESVKIQVI